MINEDIDFLRLEKYKNKLLKIQIYSDKKIECCPHCNSNYYVKNGKYDGIQRYKCRSCSRTFSKTTKALWSYSKINAEKWIKFTELTLQKQTLRFCAEELGISLVTAFYWRHKIMQGLTLDLMAETIPGRIFMSKTIEKENFKGCRKNKPKTHRNIWIVAAKGIVDSMVIKVIGMDYWNSDNFDEQIYSKIKDCSYITVVNDTYMTRVAKEHNKIIMPKAKMEPKIQKFGMYIKMWIEDFKGIATKYLERYLNYFVLFNLYKSFDSIKMTYDLSEKNRFIKVKDIRSFNNLV